MTWLMIRLFKCHLSYWALQIKGVEDIFHCLVDVVGGEGLSAFHGL